MTPEEALEQLKLIKYNYEDVENAHIQADAILLTFLESLGYKEIVAEFDSIDKWYS